jgi:hypothetical protein
MSTPFTTCEEGMFQLKFQQERLGCAFFTLAAAVPSTEDIEPTIKTISDIELDAMARNYVCYKTNVWRFSGRCPSVDAAAQREVQDRVDNALKTVNKELKNRNLAPQAEDTAFGAGWIALITILCVVVVAVILRVVTRKLSQTEEDIIDL